MNKPYLKAFFQRGNKRNTVFPCGQTCPIKKCAVGKYINLITFFYKGEREREREREFEFTLNLGMGEPSKAIISYFLFMLRIVA